MEEKIKIKEGKTPRKGKSETKPIIIKNDKKGELKNGDTINNEN